MAARQMLQHLQVAMCVAGLATTGAAQGTPLRLGPLTVMVPQGWTTQTNTVPVRLFSPESNPAQFVAVQVYPPEQTSQDVRQHHMAVWGTMANVVHASGVPRSGATGRFISHESTSSAFAARLKR